MLIIHLQKQVLYFIKSNLYGFDFINGVKLTLKDNYDRENTK